MSLHLAAGWQVMRSPNGTINADPERFPGGMKVPADSRTRAPPCTTHSHASRTRHGGTRGLHPFQGPQVRRLLRAARVHLPEAPWELGARGDRRPGVLRLGRGLQPSESRTPTLPPFPEARATLNQARFLHDEALTQVQERLEEVNRSFTDPAIITAHPEIWGNAAKDALVIPDTETPALKEQAHDLIIHAMTLHWADVPVGQLVPPRRARRHARCAPRARRRPRRRPRRRAAPGRRALRPSGVRCRRRPVAAAARGAAAAIRT